MSPHPATKDWRNAPDLSTPIDAAALEDLEDRHFVYSDQHVGGKPLAAPGAGEDGQGFVYDNALQAWVWTDLATQAAVDAKLDDPGGSVEEDLLLFRGGAWDRLAVGTTGQLLVVREDGTIGYLEPPRVYAQAWGADPTHGVDAAPKIQNAINHAAAMIDGAGPTATGVIVDLGHGYYKCLSALTRPGDKAVHLVGAGRDSCILDFPNDLGAGVRALDYAGPATGSVQHVTQGFFLRGQQTQISAALGAQTVNNDGMRVVAGERFEDITVKGFRRGVEIWGDHQMAFNVHATGNFDNVYFPAGQPTVGDQAFYACGLEGAKRAGVAVAANSLIQTVEFNRCHFGFGPYAFYREAAATYGGWLLNTTLNRCSCEAVGNGSIFDASGAGFVQGLVLIASNLSWNGANKIAASAADYTVDVRGIYDTEVIGSPSWFTEPGAVGGTRCGADGYNGLNFRTGEEVITRAIATGKPPFSLTDPTKPTRISVQTRSYRARVRAATGAITTGDLVEKVAPDAGGADKCQRSVGTGTPDGFAVTPAAGAGALVVVVNEDAGVVTANATGAIAAGDAVEPDAQNAGKVIAVTIGGALPRVGHARKAAAAGQVELDVRVEHKRVIDLFTATRSADCYTVPRILAILSNGGIATSQYLVLTVVHAAKTYTKVRWAVGALYNTVGDLRFGVFDSAGHVLAQTPNVSATNAADGTAKAAGKLCEDALSASVALARGQLVYLSVALASATQFQMRTASSIATTPIPHAALSPQIAHQQAYAGGALVDATLAAPAAALAIPWLELI